MINIKKIYRQLFWKLDTYKIISSRKKDNNAIKQEVIEWAQKYSPMYSDEISYIKKGG